MNSIKDVKLDAIYLKSKINSKMSLPFFHGRIKSVAPQITD